MTENTLEWLGDPDWFPASVVSLKREGDDAWSLVLVTATGLKIPLLVVGATGISDKKPLGMVVTSIALVVDGRARWVELRGQDGDDAYVAFQGSAVRLELGRYRTTA